MESNQEFATEGSAASRPAIIEHFSVKGLYGNRTVSLSSKYAATILIAKNGSGKTTLLAALDAFLKGQFSRLTGLQFSSIECKLRGINELLVLEQSDVLRLSAFTENSLVLSVAKQFAIDPVALVDFIDDEYQSDPKSGRELHNNEMFEQILSKVGYSMMEARKICDRLVDALSGRSQNIEIIRAALRAILKGVEVVYLPTYRRIELPLSVDPEDRPRGRRRKSVQSILGISKRNLFNADIQFGLSDISERLSALNQNILGLSNQGYRETSASIINELLNGEFERQTERQLALPTKEALKLFFARIKQGEGRYYGPYSEVAIPDIDKIYSGEITGESNKFLTYYLSKLNRVIETTRGIELPVETFIDSCNRYLSAEDTSVAVRSNKAMSPEGLRKLGPGDKILRLNRRNLQVRVEGFPSKRKMSLDVLSSGEKQMVSLFARLYLYPGKKIFLIDEPELSLSIGWQQKILEDILGAPLCDQVIAITHSPFVFDNSLEPYAQALTIKVDDTPVEGDLFDEDDGVEADA